VDLLAEPCTAEIAHFAICLGERALCSFSGVRWIVKSRNTCVDAGGESWWSELWVNLAPSATSASRSLARDDVHCASRPHRRSASNKSSYSEISTHYPPLPQLASQMIHFNSGEHGLGFPHLPVTNPHRIALYTDVFS
jgi:hypothetical protein